VEKILCLKYLWYLFDMAKWKLHTYFWGYMSNLMGYFDVLYINRNETWVHWAFYVWIIKKATRTWNMHFMQCNYFCSEIFFMRKNMLLCLWIGKTTLWENIRKNKFKDEWFMFILISLKDMGFCSFGFKLGIFSGRCRREGEW
jgi:hypothetical protein